MRPNLKVANACLHSVGGVWKGEYAVFNLRYPKVTVGRDMSCTCCIIETTVSRLHFILKFEDDNWILYDKSSFGTFLNDNKVPKDRPIMLKDNDVISIGAQKNKLKYMFHKTSDSSQPCTRAMLEPREGSSSDSDGECFIVETPPEPRLRKKRRLDEPQEVLSTISIASDSQLDDSVQIMEDSPRPKTEKCQGAEQVDQRLGEEQQREVDRRLAEAHGMGQKEIQGLVAKALEEELECSICSELLINATMINCSHVFCQLCISEWRKMMPGCPICRRKITNLKPCRVNGIIDKIMALLPQENQAQRQQALGERAAEMAKKNLVPRV